MTDLNIRTINLDQKPSPAILASILGVTEPMIYKYREKGQLPSNLSASYAECILHFINYYKTLAAGKSGDVAQLKMIHETRNLIAKEEMQWLEIKKLRQELGDYKEIKDLIEPVLYIIHSSLVTISRQFPDTRKSIDNAIESIYSLGKRIAEQAQSDGDAFVRERLEKELTLDEAENVVEKKFGLGE